MAEHFARIFNFLLPPLYAPNFAQVGIDLDCLGVGIALGVVTALGLTALFESLQVLEDPFTGHIALDGIDVQEEFEVLLFSSLVNTREEIYPLAPPYPRIRRAALTTTPHCGLSSLARMDSETHLDGTQRSHLFPPPKLEINRTKFSSIVSSIVDSDTRSCSGTLEKPSDGTEQALDKQDAELRFSHLGLGEKGEMADAAEFGKPLVDDYDVESGVFSHWVAPARVFELK